MSRYLCHTDTDLIKLLKESDEEAFETIYRRYARDLNQFAFRKIGSRQDGEEIVQEIFIWLWDNGQDLDRITNLRTYLFQAARNRILNYYRSVKVRRNYAMAYQVFEVNRDNSADQQLELSELKEAIEKSLTDLPERCQMAFRLSRMENMTISDIAKHMGISHRTVENYISQALKHLRNKLNESNESDGAGYSFRIILFL